MDVQRLLAEIEVDMQELKFLLDAFSKNPDEIGRRIVKRDVERIQAQLADLWKEVENLPVHIAATPVVMPVAPIAPVTEIPTVAPKHEKPATSILAERIRPAADLRRSISLNDSFRFSRELFGGSAEQMNAVLQRISETASLNEALVLLAEEVKVEEDNDVVNDLQELIRKFFT